MAANYVWLRRVKADDNSFTHQFECSDCGELIQPVLAMPEAVWEVFRIHAHTKHPNMTAVKVPQVAKAS